MNIVPIESDGYLYAVSDVFSQYFVDKILATPWLDLPYNRLEIGRNKRREILAKNIPYWAELNQFIQQQLRPCIEEQCKVKFVDDKFFSINWWVDEPGFKPAMHTDGNLPSAMQIYILTNNDESLGTTFFNTQSTDDVMHRFPSVFNTGYMMFNSHTVDGKRKLLWHDMECPVPPSVFRVCCYITLGGYQR